MLPPRSWSRRCEATVLTRDVLGDGSDRSRKTRLGARDSTVDVYGREIQVEKNAARHPLDAGVAYLVQVRICRTLLADLKTSAQAQFHD